MARKYKTKPDWYCDRCGRPLWADRSKWRWVETSFRWEACEKCAREFDAVIGVYEKPMWERQRALRGIVPTEKARVR